MSFEIAFTKLIEVVMSLNDRKGRFKIALDNSTEGFAAWYDSVQAVIKRCVIVRAELDVLTNMIEYSAYSSYFDEAEAGCMIPEYLAITKTDEHGHPEFVKFERVK